VSTSFVIREVMQDSEMRENSISSCHFAGYRIMNETLLIQTKSYLVHSQERWKLILRIKLINRFYWWTERRRHL
jgi:hypothetical protein